jgi:hypothetical protein
LRTSKNIEEEGDFRLLYFLSLFGLKAILKDEYSYSKFFTN